MPPYVHEEVQSIVDLHWNIHHEMVQKSWENEPEELDGLHHEMAIGGPHHAKCVCGLNPLCSLTEYKYLGNPVDEDNHWDSEQKRL